MPKLSIPNTYKYLEKYKNELKGYNKFLKNK